MKKIIGILAILAITSCSQKKAPEEKKTIVVVPVTPTILVKDPPEKSTTIILDKDGVKVATKKVSVVVNPKKKN